MSIVEETENVVEIDATKFFTPPVLVSVGSFVPNPALIDADMGPSLTRSIVGAVPKAAPIAAVRSRTELISIVAAVPN